MIRNTFQMLQGISNTWEERLWHKGIRDWHDFLNQDISGITLLRKTRFNEQLREAGQALIEEDSAFFYGKLKQSESWRFFTDFKDDAMYLDIETTGLGNAQVTVIGMYDGRDAKTLVRGINLNRQTLIDCIKGAKLIVTFNGATFDLPFIERCFPGSLPRIPHLDLRTACAKCGLNGGLKAIEREIGIRRREHIERLHGGDAVSLWRCYNATGDRHYLKMLLEYNEEDTVNLERLACLTAAKLESDIRIKHFS